MLDAAKAKSKNPGWHLPGANAKASDGAEHEDPSEEARVEIEQAEDEFVGQTEEAVGTPRSNMHRYLIPQSHSETLPTLLPPSSNSTRRHTRF